MARSIKDGPKKIGRPTMGKDPMVGARFSLALTARVDAWAAKTEGGISRAAAIRRLVEMGLKKR